jgi:hypothetical protein
MSQQPGTEVLLNLTPEEIARITAQAQALVKLTDEQITSIGESIKQAEKLVTTVLEPDIDFGIHPGTSSMALRDSGGSKIANAFNCFPDYTILNIREDDEVISYLIQVKLIHRGTGRVVATGVGACSTMESKYAYRYVEDPAELGLDKASLKFDKKKKKWRIPNPETEDLGNTILKMAAKRGEIDASQSLPGVSSALKKLFLGKVKGKDQNDGHAWQKFWGEVTALGLSEAGVHEMLGIKSLKDDWLAKGKGLNEAAEVLAKMVASGRQKKEVFDRFHQPLPPPRNLETIKLVADLLRACNEDFGLQPAQVYAELNVGSAGELEALLQTKSAAACYTEIATVRK